MPVTGRVKESLLFDYETTSKTDYRGGEIRPLVKTTYRVKNKCPRPPYVPLKDLHALTPWRNPNLPFDLYHTPKEIIRTDPRIIQKRYARAPDLDREEVQKTRPKVVMTPALDLDRVEEPTRQKFVDHVYVSTAAKALREAVEKADFTDEYAPLSDVYAPSNPVTIERLVEPYVSPEWRMNSVSWDKRQLRIHTEPTKSFWLSFPPPYCRSCKESEIMKAHKKRICETKFGGRR